jgi:hypothetical protein
MDEQDAQEGSAAETAARFVFMAYLLFLLGFSILRLA